MTSPENNNKDDKQQQIDKINDLIQSLQQSVQELQENVSDKTDEEPSQHPAKTPSTPSIKEDDSNKQHNNEPQVVVVNTATGHITVDGETKQQPQVIENTPEKEENEVSSKGNFALADTESVNYVTPVYYKKSYKRKQFHLFKKHRHHRHQHSDPEKFTDEERENLESGFVFVKPRKRKHKHHLHRKTRKRLKILGIVLGIFVGILVMLLSTVLIMNQIGKSQMHNHDDINVAPDISGVSVEDNGKIIHYGSNTYEINDSVASVVCLGIDKGDLAQSKVAGANGQSDAIYIVTVNTEKKDVSVIGVSRDSIVDVNVYNEVGGYVRAEPMQICLSYAYGNNQTSSCENTIRSLSRLFFGMDFNTYFAMDFSALRTLNDNIGGVPLTSSFTFNSEIDGHTINKGDFVTLKGVEAEQYVRSRDVSQLASNNDRMSRQKQYITAFAGRTLPAVKKDLSVATTLYKNIRNNSTTNLSATKLTYLVSTLVTNLGDYSDIEFVNVPGTVVDGGSFAEFHVDDDGLLQLMLEKFYNVKN